MLKTHITDGGGTKRAAKVLPDGSLLATHTHCPPIMLQQHKIFSQYLTDDGLAAGTNDLGVDGSTTAVEYWVPAQQKTDLYITNLSIILGYGASGYLWDFADNGAALTNGVLIQYIDTHGDATEIATIYSNSDLIRAATLEGHVPTNWELRHLGATNDYGIIAGINLKGFMTENGIQLARGTKQRIQIIIQDNVGAAADTFNCKAFGFERFE